MQLEDRVRVQHMIDAGEATARFVAGRSRDDLEQDQMLFFAVVRAIEIIGEAATKVGPETQALSPQVPWGSIVGMRNRLIHGYADINTAVLWKAATEEVPALLPLLRALTDTNTAGGSDS